VITVDWVSEARGVLLLVEDIVLVVSSVVTDLLSIVHLVVPGNHALNALLSKSYISTLDRLSVHEDRILFVLTRGINPAEESLVALVVAGEDVRSKGSRPLNRESESGVL
jgi:hypothetical protein